jgi:hypothetical protein
MRETCEVVVDTWWDHSGSATASSLDETLYDPCTDVLRVYTVVPWPRVISYDSRVWISRQISLTIIG